MCGIVGIVSKRPVAAELIEGLRRLEYRGYDSAGVATLIDGRIERSEALDQHGQPIQVKVPWWFWNLFGAQAVFLLRRRRGE